MAANTVKSTRSNTEKIIAGAEQCITEFGAQNCTMDDFAKAAGLTRKTVYRAFDNRQDLLDRVALARFELIIVEFNQNCSVGMPLVELVEYVILTATDRLKKDVVLQALLESSNHLNFSHYLMDPSSPFADSTERFFAPHLDAARERGEIKPSMNNRKFVGWLRSGQLLIMLQETLDRAEQKRFIHEFILPAVVNSPR